MTSTSSADSVMAAETPNSDDEAETSSLPHTAMEYPTHWGRRYHAYKENSYLYPNDEPECDRLDFEHELITDVFGGRLYFAPLAEEIRTILDIGTGTGIWPISLAESGNFPRARITGTDLSPIQPNNVPKSVNFQVHDCSELDWNRELGSVDFIHTRMMLGSLCSFGSFVKNARRYLRPGTGWLECHDLLPRVYSDDNSIPVNWEVNEWESKLSYAATTKLDPARPIRTADKIKAWMEEAGYVDIHEHVNKIPIGLWPKDKKLKRIGLFWRQDFLDGLSAWTYKLFGHHGLGWSQPQIEVYLAAVRKAMIEKKVHGYQKMYVVYGRRPTDQEEGLMRLPVRS